MSPPARTGRRHPARQARHVRVRFGRAVLGPALAAAAEPLEYGLSARRILVAGPAPPSRPASCRPRSAPTPAARYAGRPRCCGIVGLKPTYGLISRRGVQPNTFSIDHCGPMTRTVRDCALMLSVCAGHDPLDPGSADVPIPDYPAALTGDIKRHAHRPGAQLVRRPRRPHEVTAAVDRAAGVLAGIGAIVEQVMLPDLADYCDCKTLISISELFAIHGPDLRTRPEAFGAKLRQRVTRRSFIRAEDYLGAQRWRNDLARGLQAMFGRYDALVTAAWLTAADPANPDGVDFFRRGRNVTMPFSFAGVPALSVPIGFGAHGLPLAMQIAAAPFAETTVLRIGDAYERA